MHGEAGKAMKESGEIKMKFLYKKILFLCGTFLLF